MRNYRCHFLFVAILTLTGCSMTKLITPAASVSGAALGGAIAGPGGAAIGSGVGYATGEIYHLSSENENLEETLTQAGVEALLDSKLDGHQSTFDSFTSTIKRILIGAAIVLGCYLAIPIFVARKCSKTEAQKHMTRPPFPTK